jgi:hypothetical protein
MTYTPLYPFAENSHRFFLTQLSHNDPPKDTSITSPQYLPCCAVLRPLLLLIIIILSFILQGVLATWFVKSGAVVKADEVVGSIETDKVP